MADIEVDLRSICQLVFRTFHAQVQLTLLVIRGPLPAASATWAK